MRAADEHSVSGLRRRRGALAVAAAAAGLAAGGQEEAGRALGPAGAAPLPQVADGEGHARKYRADGGVELGGGEREGARVARRREQRGGLENEVRVEAAELAPAATAASASMPGSLARLAIFLVRSIDVL